MFALMGQRAGSGNSPTQRVLMDWGTKVSVIPLNVIFCQSGKDHMLIKSAT